MVPEVLSIMIPQNKVFLPISMVYQPLLKTRLAKNDSTRAKENTNEILFSVVKGIHSDRV